jgi:hypothetical protein
MTHDRVMRFVPVFESSDQAASYAAAQARAWIVAPASSVDPFSMTQE